MDKFDQIFLLKRKRLPVDFLAAVAGNMIDTPAKPVSQGMIAYTYDSYISLSCCQHCRICLVRGCKENFYIFSGRICDTLQGGNGIGRSACIPVGNHHVSTRSYNCYSADLAGVKRQGPVFIFQQNDRTGCSLPDQGTGLRFFPWGNRIGNPDTSIWRLFAAFSIQQAQPEHHPEGSPD